MSVSHMCTREQVLTLSRDPQRDLSLCPQETAAQPRAKSPDGGDGFARLCWWKAKFAFLMKDGITSKNTKCLAESQLISPLG